MLLLIVFVYVGKVKCHELRKVDKEGLLKQLEELKQELAMVRI